MRRTHTLAIVIAFASACRGQRGETGPEGPEGASDERHDLVTRLSTVNNTVFRVVCNGTNAVGTAFLHRSGKLITAAHVAGQCPTKDMTIRSTQDASIAVNATAIRTDLDLALLDPNAQFTGGLAFAPTPPEVGALVQWWGFPQGYVGQRPLLLHGYLAGEAPISLDATTTVYWIDGPLNHGESGAPIVELESGALIGVVRNNFFYRTGAHKRAQEMLRARERAPNKTTQHTVIDATEAAVLATALDEINENWQSDIGIAVSRASLMDFLRENNVEP